MKNITVAVDDAVHKKLMHLKKVEFINISKLTNNLLSNYVQNKICKDLPLSL